jgi:hypothetical protein
MKGLAIIATAVAPALLSVSLRAASAEDGDQSVELAKKLSNPVAALISVPLQFNYDSDLGPDENGDQYLLNFQPVVPISLDENWNLISRTIVPIIHQEDVFPGTGASSGIGNILQSLFFSPKAPTKQGIIWGVGPAIQLPTASTERFGLDQWALGPTFVVLTQKSEWTIGVLGNQLWSVSGNHGEQNSSAMYLQPFVSYTTHTAMTFSLNTESTYNWETERWAVPVNFQVTQVARIGKQLVSLGGGVGYWIMSPRDAAEGWRARVVITFLFPKH